MPQSIPLLTDRKAKISLHGSPTHHRHQHYPTTRMNERPGTFPFFKIERKCRNIYSKTLLKVSFFFFWMTQSLLRRQMTKWHRPPLLPPPPPHPPPRPRGRKQDGRETLFFFFFSVAEALQPHPKKGAKDMETFLQVIPYGTKK